MLIPFSRNDDLTGATASEVDTEAVTIPLGTRRHGDGRNLRESVSRPGLSHFCELALDWNRVASGRDVVEDIAYVEAITILNIREVVDLSRDHLERGILREHGVQNPEGIPNLSQGRDMLLLKWRKRLPVLDRIWLVNLGVVPQDLSPSDRVFRAKCMRPGMCSSIRNPVKVYVASIKDLVDRTLLINDRID